MYDRNELLKALKVIRDTCNDSDCKTCPLANGSEACLVQTETPALWNIKGDEEVVWRAFND